MAQRTHVELTDDLDPDLEAHETITFALDGISYEIDLHEDHAEELRAALEKFTANARRVTARRTTPRRRRSSTEASTTVDSTTVREWAKNNGLAVSDRGRVSAALVAQFQEATG